MHIVRIKLRQTSEQGFLVTLTHDKQQLEIEGFLPLFPQALQYSFKQWQSAYRQLEDVRLYIAPKPGLRLTPKSVKIASNSEYTNAVKTHLNQWLNSGNSDWQTIRDGLISLANQLDREVDKEIQLIVDTKDIDLRRLPWQEWDLLEKYYPSSEVALSTPKNKNYKIRKILPRLDSIKARILVVVGRSNDINTQSDLEVIQQLEKHGAEVVCLMQPKLKDLCEALWDDIGYHIFIFTGHSGSREDGKIGWIEANERESLTIEEFRDALGEAINKGLQLAIFNSCDGLGLANQLAELNLPQSIVMREPVPDQVAVEFLQYFFNEFTCNKSLFASVQKARKRLEPFKSRYPGAVWLPTLCLNPLGELFTWQEISGNRSDLQNILPSEIISNTTSKITSKTARNIGFILLTSLLSFALGFGIHIIFPSIYQAAIPNYSKISAVDARPQGTWQYGGSTTWEPIRERVDKKIKQEHPKFKLIYTLHPTLPMGSGTGIKMLLEDEISFAQSSRPIKDSEYDVAVQRGVMLKQVPVSIDGIAIAVNPNLSIKGLTVEQLKSIYTGRIKNWSQLGGPNLEIIPYSRPSQSGTTEFWRENILGNSNFGDNVIFIEETPLALKKVSDAKNPGGIYFASAAEVVGQCEVKPLPISRRFGSAFIAPYKGEWISPENCPQQRNKLNFEALQNGEYPLTRRLFVIIDQNNQADEQVGETYKTLLLTDEGQQLIKEAGFIPIRSF